MQFNFGSVHEQTNYWNDTHSTCIEKEDGKPTGKVNTNVGKQTEIIKRLYNNIEWAPLRKLEIGCGMGLVPHNLKFYNPLWVKDYIGIDISSVAINKAIELGVEAYIMNITAHNLDSYDLFKKKIDVFLFLDSLEHIDDLDRCAENVKKLASEQYFIAINLPMGTGYHNENKDSRITPQEAKQFMKDAGCEIGMDEVWHADYRPFCWLEGTNVI